MKPVALKNLVLKTIAADAELRALGLVSAEADLKQGELTVRINPSFDVYAPGIVTPTDVGYSVLLRLDGTGYTAEAVALSAAVKTLARTTIDTNQNEGIRKLSVLWARGCASRQADKMRAAMVPA